MEKLQKMTQKQFFKALQINPDDVLQLRQLSGNKIQVVFKDGHKVVFNLTKGILILL